MTKAVELNIRLNSQTVYLFQQLCTQHNSSIASAISEYMLKCIQTQRLLAREDSSRTNLSLEQIIDQRIAVALERQATQILSLNPTQSPNNSDEFIETTINKEPSQNPQDNDRSIDLALESQTTQSVNLNPTQSQNNIDEFIETTINKEPSQNPQDNDRTLEEKSPLVLVVEDSRTWREMLCLALTKGGYRVEAAIDGQEAWEKLRSGLNCDLIFCDLEMPRLNGLDLLSRIKQYSDFSCVPIAILTFATDEQYQQRAKQLGANAYLIKPYTEENLLKITQQLLQGKTLISSRATSVPQKPSHLKQSLTSSTSIEKASLSQLPAPTKVVSLPRVMIIDDSVVIRQMVAMSLSKVGYLVEQARDGMEALERLKSGLPCHLIICDIEMPRMNGLEFLSLIQEQPHLASIPVAMLTSQTAQKIKQMAVQRGAKAYFVKPYVEKNLINAAQRLINGEVLLETLDNNDNN